MARGGLVTACVAVGTSAVVVTSVWVHGHPYFALQAVEVLGAGGSEHVRRWTGLRPEISLWSIDADRVAARLRRHARIRRVNVTREFPDRVRIEVEERQPIGVFRPDEPLFVGRDGIVFAPLPGEPTEGLPWISGVSLDDLDERPAWALYRLRHAAAIISGWERFPLWPRISEVRPEDRGEVVVYPERIRIAVRFGGGADGGAFRRLDAVFEQWRGNEASVAAIDLTVPGQAVLRMRKGAHTRASSALTRTKESGRQLVPSRRQLRKTA